MALKDQIAELVTPALSQAGFYLEDVQVATPGKHRIITVIVDGDTSLNLDQVTAATKAISELLDTAPFMGDTPFTLEVTSPGVDRPLTLARHWRKNVDRKVRIVFNDGKDATGRIVEASETHVTLSEPDATFSFADMKRAYIEIEFNKKEARK